ncbi:MAG: tetratricopeptide repeat protein [Gallintestinimicrobium sp.]
MRMQRRALKRRWGRAARVRMRWIMTSTIIWRPPIIGTDRSTKAINVYQAITDLKPGEKTAWYLKGTMELEQGSMDAAKADFDKAVEAAPNDYDIRIDIFCSCSKYGQDDLGKSYLENVLDGDRKRFSDFDLGRISYYLGDYEQARTSLEKAQENGGAEAASLLGQTYEALGDYNYAASVYNTYLQNKTPDASLYNQLGFAN